MRKTLAFAALLTGLCLCMGALTLSISGCSSLARNLDIVNPRYSIRNVRPRVDIAIPLSASSIDFDFTLGVDNPNRVGLRLDQIDFNLFINDSRVLDGVSQQGLRIPAQGRGEVLLRTRLGYQNARMLFNEIADMVRGERARYEIRGNAYYDTPVGRLKFPVAVHSSQ
jgi:LEA14-like dessication related protein